MIDEIETDEDGYECSIYLPPEELLELQRKKTEIMRQMLDKVNDRHD